MTLKFDSSKEMGERVLEVTIQGKPMELDKTYKMASCNRTGEPLHMYNPVFSNSENAKIQDYTLHDAVEEYLKEKGTVSPVLDGRSIAVDLGTSAFSQMAETGYKFR